MPIHNVELTDHYEQFVNELVTSGRFADADEVMRAGLRLLEQQTREDERRLAALRAVAADAFAELDQGLGTVVEDERQLAQLIGRLGRSAAETVERRTTTD